MIICFSISNGPLAPVQSTPPCKISSTYPKDSDNPDSHCLPVYFLAPEERQLMTLVNGKIVLSDSNENDIGGFYPEQLWEPELVNV